MLVLALDAVQLRVLGTLIEKGHVRQDSRLYVSQILQTLNELRFRDWQSFDEEEVRAALDELKDLGLVEENYISGGYEAKWADAMSSLYELSDAQALALSSLMIWGPQTNMQLPANLYRFDEFKVDNLAEYTRATMDSLMIHKSGQLVAASEIEMDSGDTFEMYFHCLSRGSGSASAMKAPIRGVTNLLPPDGGKRQTGTRLVSPALNLVSESVAEELLALVERIRNAVEALGDDASDLEELVSDRLKLLGRAQ